MKKDWSQARWIAILPLLAVVLMYLVEGATRGSFFECQGGFGCKSIPDNITDVIRLDAAGVEPAAPPAQTTDPDLKERNLTTLRAIGRINWFSLVKIFLLVCVAAFAVAAILVWQRFPRRPWRWLLGILLGSACVGLLSFAFPQFHMRVFMAFFDHGIQPDLPGIRNMINFLNSLGNAATFTLLLTICTILLPTPPEPYPAGLKQLSQKMKSLQAILYAGTLLLVITMLLKNSIYQWTLAFTSQDGAALANARSLVASFVSMDGTFFTLVLAAAYLPAWFVLRRRARLLVDLPADEAEVAKKLQEFGMSFSYIQSIPRVVAIFAPFLAGPVGELIKTFLT